MRVFRLAAAVAAAVLMLGSHAAHAQQPQFRSRVELVRLHVAVLDDGQFVSGLGAADFVVEVDGAERAVELVTEIDLRDAAGSVSSAPPEPPAMELSPDAWSRRHFVILLDAVFQRREKLGVCRTAARAFLREMARADDRVALAAFGRRGVVLLEAFTADHARIERRMDEVGSDWSWWISHARHRNGPFVAAQDHPLPATIPAAVDAGLNLTPGLLPEHYPSYTDLVAAYLAGIRELARGLQAIEGRKQLLLYSPGVSAGMASVPDIPDRIDAANPVVISEIAGDEYYGRSLRQLAFDAAESLRDADTGVHSFNTDRVGSRVGLFFQWYMKDETGGSMRFHTHRLERPTAIVERLSRQFYIVAYRRYSTDPDRVNLDLRVARPGVEVIAPTRMALAPDRQRLNHIQRALVGEPTDR